MNAYIYGNANNDETRFENNYHYSSSYEYEPKSTGNSMAGRKGKIIVHPWAINHCKFMGRGYRQYFQ